MNFYNVKFTFIGKKGKKEFPIKGFFYVKAKDEVLAYERAWKIIEQFEDLHVTDLEIWQKSLST